MKLAEFCIRRPVLTVVMQLLVVAFGVVSYTRLEVRDLPKLDIPVVSVSAYYTGASAEIVEAEVTRKIEDALASLEGMDVLSSESKDGASEVTVVFRANYPSEKGLNNIRDKISQISRDLPDVVDPPTISKADINADPTLYATVTDGHRSIMNVTNYIETYVKPVVERMDGVSKVELWGARKFSVRVWPEPRLMAAHGITVQDISQALRAHNASVGGGAVKSSSRNYTIVPKTRLTNIDDFRRLILREGHTTTVDGVDDSDQVVRLADVAKVEVGPEYDDVYVRSSGRSGLIMAVTPQSTANPVTVSQDVIRYLNRVKKTLPEGMHLNVNYDKAVFINASINNVYESLAEAVFLVILVVIAFLGNLRGALVPVLTIPICLLGIFGVMYALDYSINNMTLLALVLAIGLVVDDAIVMLENVHRHIEQGKPPMQAAKAASKEIGFAIVSMTLTLVAVYAPIGLITGMAGPIFQEFAFTLAGTVLISGAVALTLSPMMCARMLPENLSEEGRYATWLNATMARLQGGYQKWLQLALRHRLKVLGIVVIFAVAGLWQMSRLPAELAPTEDQGLVMAAIIAPSGANRSYLERQTSAVEKIWQATPGYLDNVIVGGVPVPNQGFSVLILKPWEERTLSSKAVLGHVAPQLMAIPGALVFPFEPQALPSSGSDPIKFIVQLAGSYQELHAIMQRLQETIEKENPNIIQPRVHLDLDTPQLALAIDRERVADSGVNVSDIMNTLSVLMGGQNITEFQIGSQNYNVLMKLSDEQRRNPSQISELYVRNKDGEMIPLTNLVKITPQVGAKSLMHYNRVRSASLTASLAPGYTQGEAVEYFQKLAKRALGDQAQYSWGGQTKEFLESSGTMMTTIGLALLVIYLVLAAQFESFRDPLIILLTVPFSMVGAVLALTLVGGTNNLYTQIGFVTLIGLVTKHGILITEFANQLRAQGMAMYDAVVQAASTRLRPILMTTGAMVLGAIPLAIASGAGAYSRSQLGWTIVGGMLVGTAFSLLVVPLTYTLLSKSETVTERQ